MQEEEEVPHVVKLRINASGRRVIGFLDVAAAFDRVSDLLNSADPFLMVEPEVESHAGGGDDAVAILKDAVSYVEALEERHSTTLSSPPAGDYQSVLVELAIPPTVIRANIFVPEGQAFADVLNDERRFVSLRNVEVQGSVEIYSYLAVGKKQIVVLRALSHEPQAKTGP
jgi:hypothetical protein